MALAHRSIRFVIPAGLLLALSLAFSCCGDDPVDITDSTGDDTTSGPIIDLSPPQPITDPSLVYLQSTNEVLLEWTAPSDDSLQEAVSRYEIRYSYHELFKVQWDLGILVMDPPTPSAPGTREHVIIRFPLRANNMFARIRSYDEANNHSSADDFAHVYIPGLSFSGQCIDAYTRQPVEGFSVKVASNGYFNRTSDEEGRFSVDDLPTGAVVVSISTGAVKMLYHSLEQRFNLTSDLHQVFYMVPFQPTESPRFTNILHLLELLTWTNYPKDPRTLRTWSKRPVKCYIPPYVNSRGVDYQVAAIEAAERWMERSEGELFTFVDAPPDTGIIFYYKSSAEMSPHIGITVHVNGTDGLPLRDEISVVNSFTSNEGLYKVVLHELGHTLRFHHLPYPEFIMYSSHPLPPDISNDEANALKLLLALPNQTNMAIYDESNPR